MPVEHISRRAALLREVLNWTPKMEREMAELLGMVVIALAFLLLGGVVNKRQRRRDRMGRLLRVVGRHLPPHA